MQHEEAAKQLFIPEKVKVGYRKRDDTYTGELAYVIYYDKKGELRKEKSWQSWRDHKIAAKDLTNEPTEGFVLNKKVGGYKSHWNFRDAHVRVYDPRGFEFEISVPNLLFILREGDCSRGKGLEGKFVYAWEGTELVLLPVHSEDYKRSSSFTDLQGKTVGVKELVQGAAYFTRKQEELTYLGRFDYYFQVEISRNHYFGYSSNYGYGRRGGEVNTADEYNPVPKKDQAGSVKKFVFWNGKDFVFLNDVKSLAALKDATVHPDYADLVDKYNKSPHGSKAVKLFLKEVAEKKQENHHRDDPWFYEDKDGSFVECTTNYHWQDKTKIEYIQASHRYFIDEKTGLLTQQDYHRTAYAPGQPRRHHDDEKNAFDYHEPTKHRLFAQTENGCKHRVQGPGYNYGFHKEK